MEEVLSVNQVSFLKTSVCMLRLMGEKRIQITKTTKTTVLLHFMLRTLITILDRRHSSAVCPKTYRAVFETFINYDSL